MTTRHAGYLVVLSEDVREDDADAIQMALSMVRGVLAVTPVPASPDLWMATRRARADLIQRILDVLGD